MNDVSMHRISAESESLNTAKLIRAIGYSATDMRSYQRGSKEIWREKMASIDEPPQHYPPPPTEPKGSLGKIVGSGLVSVCTCIFGVALVFTMAMFGYGGSWALGMLLIGVSFVFGYVCCKGILEASG